MTLNPQAAALLALLPPHVDASSLTVEQHRAQYAEVVRLRRGDGWVPEPVGSSQDVDADGVPCRLHQPEGGPASGVLVYLHGGGWVVGGLDSHEGVARALCRRGGFAVLAVDYRLAPEHPYPIPLEDCLTATRWAAQHFRSVAVGGDSAGGTLAAAVALACRATGPALAGQVLVYPAVDGSLSSPSYASVGEGYGLTEGDMRWYWEQYAQAADRTDPLLSPAAAPDLVGLPPAVVVTAEYDVLRDEGDSWAQRLRDAGVPTVSWQAPGLVHGFLGQGGTVAAADATLSEIASATAGLLA